jgi:hypothetical protein
MQMAPYDNNHENSPSRLGRTTGEAMIPRTDRATTQRFLTKIAICLLPLALTPLLAILISEGYLNLGGGCKDIILLIPWLLWSLLYSVFFIVLWIRGRSFGQLIAVFRSGSKRCYCAGVDSHTFFSGFDWSAYGLPKVIVYFSSWIRVEDTEDLA